MTISIVLPILIDFDTAILENLLYVIKLIHRKVFITNQERLHANEESI